MKRLITFALVLGLLFVPSVTLAEYYPPLPDYIEEPEDTATIANQIEDTTGTYEPVEAAAITPVSVPAPVIETTQAVTPVVCSCDLEPIRGSIRELYQLDGMRFDEIQDNYDDLVGQIDELQRQIYELGDTTSY